MTFISKYFKDLSGREVYDILKARMKVFLLEQNIVCLDTDDIDKDSLHCFLEEDGEIIAYLRAFYENESTVSIGRVLTVTHGVGHGRRLMEESIAAIKEMLPSKTLTLHSQTHAAPFYEKFGFKAFGEEFLEEGVPHIMMKKEL